MAPFPCYKTLRRSDGTKTMRFEELSFEEVSLDTLYPQSRSTAGAGAIPEPWKYVPFASRNVLSTYTESRALAGFAPLYGNFVYHSNFNSSAFGPGIRTLSRGPGTSEPVRTAPGDLPLLMRHNRSRAKR